MFSFHGVSFLSVFCILNVVNGLPAQPVKNAAVLPNLLDVTLEELTTGLERHDFTSVDLVKAYTARIKEVNSRFKAITELNPDALTIAATLDASRANGTIKGPLHGIPILIKNNMATADQMNNTAGSTALLGATVSRDSTVAAKLRSAGAILLGKGNMSQWASWRGNITNGWSAYGGQCEGIYYPSQDPSGSSSGPAVATGLGLTFAALGSETAGSIILPAAASNVVGIKPTVGLTSRSLVIPVSPRQDTIGSIARTVRDAAAILQTIVGHDPLDNYTLAQPTSPDSPTQPDYLRACNLSALQGARIGVARNLIYMPSPADNTSSYAVFQDALSTLTAAGATIVDNLNITAFALDVAGGTNALAVLNADFVSSLPSHYLDHLLTNPYNISTVADLQSYTQSPAAQLRGEQYPHFSTEHWAAGLTLGYDNTSPQFWETYTLGRDTAGRDGIIGLMRNYSLDAIVAPTGAAFDLPARVGTPVVTVPMGFDGEMGTVEPVGGAGGGGGSAGGGQGSSEGAIMTGGGSQSSAAAVAAGNQSSATAVAGSTTPSSAPTVAGATAGVGGGDKRQVNDSNQGSQGQSGGGDGKGGANDNRWKNPVGLGFMGDKWSEEKLIGYAYAFEQRTMVRLKGRQPYLVPKTELGDVMGGKGKNSSASESEGGQVSAESVGGGGGRRRRK